MITRLGTVSASSYHERSRRRATARRRRPRLALTLLLAALLALAISSAAASAVVTVDPWVTTQITDDSYEDASPSVFGDRVAWYGWDGHDYEIFTWESGDSSPTRLSYTDRNDYYPQVSGDVVVWWHYDSSDWEVLMWKAGDSSPTSITDNDYFDSQPQISGDRIVWQGGAGADGEIYTWKLGDSSPTRITNNAYGDYSPQVSGDRVAWYAYPDGGSGEIYTWKLGDTTPTRLTDNIYADDQVAVSGDLVVWRGYNLSPGDYDIFAWKVGVDTSADNISDDVYMDSNPSVSGDRVVYQGSDGSDNEIFAWDYGDSSPWNLSNNTSEDSDPHVSGDRVVWVLNDGDDEIFTWEQGDPGPTRLTENAYEDSTPRVQGDRVVWHGGTSTADMDIYTALELTPHPYDDKHHKITYSPAWSRWDNSGYWAASGDTYAYTDKMGDKAIVTFEGTALSWVAATSNTKGKAKVTLDPGYPGEIETTVDLYSPTTQWKQTVYSTGDLTYGVHTVVIECLYEKNAASVWYTIDADRFDVTGTLIHNKIDDKDLSHFAYDPDWSHWDNSGYWAAYLDTYAYTSTPGDEVTFTFDGTQASWVACTSNTKGKAEVRLYEGSADPGNLLSTEEVDLYSPTTKWKQTVYSTGILSPGPHTIEIECLGTRNWAAWYHTIDVDRFDVLLGP